MHDVQKLSNCVVVIVTLIHILRFYNRFFILSCFTFGALFQDAVSNWYPAYSVERYDDRWMMDGSGRGLIEVLFLHCPGKRWKFLVRIVNVSAEIRANDHSNTRLRYHYSSPFLYMGFCSAGIVLICTSEPEVHRRVLKIIGLCPQPFQSSLNPSLFVYSQI
jgi:hypothetical protein